MNKKTKRIITALASVMLLVLLAYVVKFFLDAPYRKQLPENPAATMVSKPVHEQIATARQQACINTTAGNIGRLGMVYYSYGDNAKAALCYRLAAQKNSNAWIWNYYLGYANLELGELPAAIENFKQVIAKHPENDLALYYSGEAYQKLGSDKAAEKYFTAIVTSNNTDVADTNMGKENYFPLKTYARFQLARIYLNANRLSSAETTLRELVKNQMTFGPAYRLLGNVYKVKGDLVLSDKYAARANDLADYTPPADKYMNEIARLSRSDQYLLKQIDNAVRSGNFRWALTLCDQALQYFPDNKFLVSNAFFMNLRLGNNKKALSYLDKHLRYFSDNARELMDAMDFLYNDGLYDASLQYFNAAKKLLPGNSSLAMWLYERGKKSEAIVLLNEQMKNNPGNEKILADVIRVLLDAGDDELAQKYFAQLKQNAPASPEAMQIKGAFAEKDGDLKAALAAYEASLKAGATDLLFLKAITNAYVRDHNWEQALQHFKTALDMYPNDPELLEGFGRMLMACPDPALRNMQEGLEYSQRAFVNINSHYKTKLAAGKNLATAYVSLGDKKNAVLYINKTITLAKEKNLADTYVSYFRELVSKK